MRAFFEAHSSALQPAWLRIFGTTGISFPDLAGPWSGRQPLVANCLQCDVTLHDAQAGTVISIVKKHKAARCALNADFGQRAAVVLIAAA